MNKIKVLSLICFFIGIVFFTLGFLKGDVEGGIIVIFPFIAGTGINALLGFIFFMLAFFLFIYSFKTDIKVIDEMEEEKIKDKKTSIKGGGVVLIGPIPIVFGSNWKIALLLMIVAIIIILLSFYFLNTY